MSTLMTGTCGWKYPSWSGIVYSSPSADYLAEYARRFPTVEIDQWFWSLFDTDSIALPKAATVAEYAATVPDGFRFTIKAPNAVTLTHFYTKGSQRGSGPNPYFLSPALLADFLARIAPLKEKTASVMLQFEYLNREKMGGLGEFISRVSALVRAIDTDWPLAVEVRNPAFLRSEFFFALADLRVQPVLCQGYFLPPVMEVYAQARAKIREAVVVRLLGPDRKGIEKLSGRTWDRIVAPKDDELPRISDMVMDMLHGGLDVILNINNHYEGSAPLTIEKLERLLDDRRERFSQMR